MTFYDIVLKLVRIVFYIFNGKPHYEGLENIPEDKIVIFAATHRSLLDPIYLAFAIYPFNKKVAFMAKDTLFKNKFMAYILPKLNVFPVNREKTSPRVIKHAVKVMNEDQINLGIFPSGTRYSTEIKGGTAFIQRLSKNDIVPVAIQPTLSIGQFFKRKTIKVAFGTPIEYDETLTYDKEKLAEVDSLIAERFDQLDQQLTPNYQYIPPIKKDK
ncbi:1-acyl-sn-glycerol-3-phosphate acyltransferase [Aerococcaceae bacterium DSM 109653]|uniref:1-acyl-sn-glycerol-3-phosphate acyltransferase n=1 Tax=Fundicoccus ignavus TaxID=2664442 RepID=A0A844BFC1_9LACT|nr:1-acyl-sn-glycerol-3-phosphate acyltransferase [Fundicoccus ignavus]MRI80660.1 1-acyl-sn-glycerol-3-phosphate acyltransferase [Fundicoccus ignavus]